jgi:hypothetical protein
MGKKEQVLGAKSEKSAPCEMGKGVKIQSNAVTTSVESDALRNYVTIAEIRISDSAISFPEILHHGISADAALCIICYILEAESAHTNPCLLLGSTKII